MTLTSGDVKRLLGSRGLRPSRALGQNFVVDPNTVRRIVRLSGVVAGANVVEIGAGLGSLTLALSEAGAKVVAVETDGRLVEILREVVDGRVVAVVEADALRVDWDALLAGHGAGAERSWQLVANLPYNVATPLLLTILEGVPQIASMLVMVQREVGDRLAARVGDPAYGAVSVKVAYWATASVVGRVPPTVFVPRPRVDSALVRIQRRAEPAVPAATVDRDRLFSVVTAGFSQRRKMLRRSLAGVVDPEAFGGAGVASDSRAEDLSVEDWGRLAGWRIGRRDGPRGDLRSTPAARRGSSSPPPS